MTSEPIPVPTRTRVSLTLALKNLKVGDTVRFPVGANYGSIRTLSTVHGIKVHIKMLDSGEIEVTRRL